MNERRWLWKFVAVSLSTILLFSVSNQSILLAAGPAGANISETQDIRPTANPADSDYWKHLDGKTIFDKSVDSGTGGEIDAGDLIQATKGASVPDAMGVSTVSIDINVSPAEFTYYPVDVVYVFDVTSSMFTSGDRLQLAKEALIQSIHSVWEANPDSTVTIIPFARSVFYPNQTTGFSYPYQSSYFRWTRNLSNVPIIGYRQPTLLPAQTANAAAEAYVEQSLYNDYPYYRITKDMEQDVDMIIQQGYNDGIVSQAQYDAYKGNTTLENSIWAIPYGEDTNTEIGLQAAYDLLSTDPNFQSTAASQRRSSVILITDGQANRSFSEVDDFPAGTPQTTIAARPIYLEGFMNDTTNLGDPNNIYYDSSSYIYQLFNRSSTSGEISRANTKAQDVSDLLRARTNMYSVLGIEVPSSVNQNVLNWVGGNERLYHNITRDDVDEYLAYLTDAATKFVAPLDIHLQDRINTNTWDYVPGSLNVTITQDNPEMVPGNYVVYNPALPTVSDTNVSEDGYLNIDFGMVPFSGDVYDSTDEYVGPLILTPNTETQIHISYDIQNHGNYIGDEIQTNVYEDTMLTYKLPAHTISADATIEYLDQYTGTMPLFTPLVSINSNLVINQLVSKDGGQTWYQSLTGKTSDVWTYKVTLTNTSDNAIRTNVADILDWGDQSPAQVLTDASYDIFRFNDLDVQPESAVSGNQVTIEPGANVIFIYSVKYDDSGTFRRNAFSSFAVNTTTKYIWDGTVVTIEDSGLPIDSESNHNSDGLPITGANNLPLLGAILLIGVGASMLVAAKIIKKRN